MEFRREFREAAFAFFWLLDFAGTAFLGVVGVFPLEDETLSEAVSFETPESFGCLFFLFLRGSNGKRPRLESDGMSLFE